MSKLELLNEIAKIKSQVEAVHFEMAAMALSDSAKRAIAHDTAIIGLRAKDMRNRVTNNMSQPSVFYD